VAEWTTFTVATLVLLALVVLIVLEAARTDTPASPVATRTGAVTRVGDRFHVPVRVRNEGDETAEAVQVVATLEIDGETSEADQTVDFLAGHDQQDLVFVFDDDPAGGRLQVAVSGFRVP
jgi:uncharacterized protein (TIGR02588 family)